MKKLITAFLILILCVPAAFPQQIRDIDETVVLHRDGSAEVTQVWDVNVVSGTEFYLPFDHLGPLDITDLQVSEGGVPFVSEGDGWDTDRSREQKRGRCGIVRKPDGVELCWGQGDYGDHVWTVSYSVKGLVMQLDSCAARQGRPGQRDRRAGVDSRQCPGLGFRQRQRDLRGGRRHPRRVPGRVRQ